MSRDEPTWPDSSDAFWRAGREIAALAQPPLAQLPPALQCLGACPFGRSGFPFLGFLATVYDHVAERVTGKG